MNDIKIDYDNINVADIMKQIQADDVVFENSVPEESPSPEDNQASSEPSLQIPEPEYLPMVSSKKKRILLKLMKPFSPLIKLLILPVHQELRQTVHRLDYTNKRLDSAVIRYGCLDITMEYVKLLHSLCHNIVVELTKLKIEEEGMRIKLRIIEKDFELLSRKEKALEKKVFK
jgi:hypothetical protein